ncbi:TPA: hypothetical protein ACKP7W_002816 [Stenotrophomonas maltophilia]|uniref:MoaF-related domain-containing protein n=1 Tax=Stenotrophomonas sp. PE591 TaxID=1812490 RepID=UPI002016722B|nr:hypothetical protein [Stenotrophomonas sp. PE591]MBS3727102.1 hypothetical protein [Stenotrophomonas sp. PE591]
MNTAPALPLFAGHRFRVSYDGLAADNVYSADGRHVQYAIVSGAYAGAQGEATCEWQQISEGGLCHFVAGSRWRNGRACR